MLTLLEVALMTTLCASAVEGHAVGLAKARALDDVLGCADTPFEQRNSEAYPIAGEGIDASAADVRAVEVDATGAVWAATKAGVYVLRDGKWTRQPGVPTGPTYDVYVDDGSSVWIGAWDGLYRVTPTGTEKIAAVDGLVAVVCATTDGMMAMGPDGAWRSGGGAWRRIEQKWSSNVRDAALDSQGDLWIATGMGLYRVTPTGVRRYHQETELISAELKSLVIEPPGGRLWPGCLWIGSWGGIDVYENGARVARFTGKEGLPSYDVRALAFAPDGALWVGTALGVARYDGTAWSLLRSRRWLPSDDVRDMAIGKDGTVWVATGAGVSAIKHKTMTLADKAAHYLDVCLKRHVRPPGLVEKCLFPDPNDTSKWFPRDDDNDGQYTSMYLAAESLRFAVTQDPAARANADHAYQALEFLQTVTGTNGFVARTVVPSDWSKMADANETISLSEAVERRVRDPRYKPVETRWRPSADGKWLWKGDTSSDEITGHFMGYLFYYDLAADEAAKERVRGHVRKVMDCIIEGGYVLRDLDGTHTRWGVWSPELLNGDPEWSVERPINSFEILSFLKTTYHITGDAKYRKEYLNLIEKHGYGENVRHPKAYGLSERSYIDDELLALAAPGLLLYEDDPQLRALYLEGYTWAYGTVSKDASPFFDFVFGLVGGKTWDRQAGLAFLRDAPLDLRQWKIDNSDREDIALVRRPMLEPLQTGRMLPPSERGVMRWDKNPWEAVSGDSCDEKGSLESSGVFWLLPYWMGRYCGFIQAPK